jgi:hypothetical protein
MPANAATPGRRVVFDTTLTATGNNTGIVVPPELSEQLGAGKRPAVLVDVNGCEYRSTVGVMGGKAMISVSAAIRAATGLKGGDPIHVTLTLADGPPPVTIPVDIAQTGQVPVYMALTANRGDRSMRKVATEAH